jgi:WD40 repeat protein
MPRPLVGDIRTVTTLDWSADGRVIAAGDADGSVVIWDAETGQQLRTARAERSRVHSLAINPNSQVVATGGCARPGTRDCAQGAIRLWDVKDAEPDGEPLIGHEGPVSALAFSPDGGTISSGGSDGTVIRWDLMTRQPVGSALHAGIGRITTLIYSPDGRILVALNDSGLYRRWQSASGRALGEVSELFRYPFISFFGSARGDSLRLPSFVWGRGSPVASLVDGSKWAAHSDRLATTRDGALVLVNSTESRFPRLEGGVEGAQIAFHPDVRRIATIGPDGIVSLLEIGSNDTIASWQTNIATTIARRAHGLVISPDGRRLAVAGCRSFQSEEERPPMERYWRPRCVESEVGVWEVESQTPITAPFTDHRAAVLALAFTPDGQRLISYGVDGSRVVRDLASDRVWTSEPPLPDQRRFAAAERDRVAEQTRILLWTRAQRPEDSPRVWHRGSAVTTLTFDPQDETLLIGGHGGSIDRWDPASQQPVSSTLQLLTYFPRVGTYEVSSVAISPDGRLLAANTDNGFGIWDLGQRQPLLEMQGESWPLVFRSDGSVLMAGAQLIDVSLESWMDQACDRLTRNLTWSEWNLYREGYPYRATCPDVPPRPMDLAAQADVLAARGQTGPSRAVLARAVSLAADRGQSVNEEMCSVGGFLGYGDVSLPACDRAVTLATSAFERDRARGMRAVARALDGDLRGAVLDLEAEIARWRTMNAASFAEEIQHRTEWIRTLEAGQNPFDANTRSSLRTR